MKFIIKKILSSFNYKIIKKDKLSSFDKIIKHFTNKEEPLIFDVGANSGQSIIRFKKIFKESIIYSFEPQKNEFQKLKSLCKGQYKNCFPFNFGLGNEEKKMNINIFKNSVHSSFLSPDTSTDWFKNRDLKFGNFFENVEETRICKLENFVKENKIDSIDLLKIDTQGFEDQVLQGSKQMILDQNINLIELEIIFGKRYTKQLSFFEIEKHLLNNYKLIAIDKATNIIDNNAYSVNCLYLRNNIE